MNYEYLSEEINSTIYPLKQITNPFLWMVVVQASLSVFGSMNSLIVTFTAGVFGMLFRLQKLFSMAGENIIYFI